MHDVKVLGTNYVIMGYPEIYPYVLTLARAIRSSGREYQTMVGFLSGGGAYARWLRDAYHTKFFRTIGIEFYKAVRDAQTTDVTRKAPIIYQPFASSEEIRQPIIAVDDVSDTGESLKVGLSHLTEKGYSDVGTATWVVKRGTKFWPTHHVVVVDENDWVIFPWERIKTIAEKLPLWKEKLPSEKIRDIVTVQMGFDHIILEAALADSGTTLA